MNENKLTLRFGVIAGMILFAAMSRLMPHPPNFSPVGAMALFGAAHFSRKIWIFAIPLVAMWLSDLVLNNTIYAAYYDGFQLFNSYSIWVYVSIVLIALLGMKLLQKVQLKTVLPALVIGSLIFFLITNLGSFFYDPIYPKNFLGLIAAYSAGFHFYLSTLAGDLFYGLILFGSFELIKSRIPSLAF